MPLIKGFNDELRQIDESWLTAGLCLAAGVLLFIAFKGDIEAKVMALAYIIFP